MSRKRLLLLLILLVAGAALYIFWPKQDNLSALAVAGEPYDVRILRDEWGVPHVFGETDADVAYGLAYAHAEDDFLTIQQTVVAARGELDIGLGGGPDVLHAIYADLADDGHQHGTAGDSYVMLVAWDSEGKVTSYSIHQYGSATSRPASPHYADQPPLFARRELKPVWMDEAEILNHLEHSYRPGEE